MHRYDAYCLPFAAMKAARRGRIRGATAALQRYAAFTTTAAISALILSPDDVLSPLTADERPIINGTLCHFAISRDAPRRYAIHICRLFKSRE